jgi:hypothetical protein
LVVTLRLMAEESRSQPAQHEREARRLDSVHSARASLLLLSMVSPTINRVKGKTLEQRKRDRRRLEKANAAQAGKIRPKGVKDRGMGKKKLKKKEQKARLLGKGSNKMEL